MAETKPLIDRATAYLSERLEAGHRMLLEFILQEYEREAEAAMATAANPDQDALETECHTLQNELDALRLEHNRVIAERDEARTQRNTWRTFGDRQIDQFQQLARTLGISLECTWEGVLDRVKVLLADARAAYETPDESVDLEKFKPDATEPAPPPSQPDPSPNPVFSGERTNLKPIGSGALAEIDRTCFEPPVMTRPRDTRTRPALEPMAPDPVSDDAPPVTGLKIELTPLPSGSTWSRPYHPDILIEVFRRACNDFTKDEIHEDTGVEHHVIDLIFRYHATQMAACARRVPENRVAYVEELVNRWKSEALQTS